MLVSSVAAPYRIEVARAFHDAMKGAYPTFLETQDTRLSKIIEKGRISSEAQFMLVRHAIDIAEGVKEQDVQLQKFYLLVEEFESRCRRK